MTDRSIGPATDAPVTADDDRVTADDDPADDRAQHASADVAPELFGW
jgi:hypothetical protein